MAACTHVAIDVYNYVDRCYTVNNYHQTYTHQFQPILHQDYWSRVEQGVIILPDKSRLRQKGRPRSSRLRNDMDLTNTQNKWKCRVCHEEGHDRQSCPTIRNTNQ